MLYLIDIRLSWSNWFPKNYRLTHEYRRFALRRDLER
jgi:hypothetical protein